jgi:chemotaxis signal transduction protein
LAVLHVVAPHREGNLPEERRLVIVLESRSFALLVDSVDGVEERPSDAALLDLDALERGDTR